MQRDLEDAPDSPQDVARLYDDLREAHRSPVRSAARFPGVGVVLALNKPQRMWRVAVRIESTRYDRNEASPATRPLSSAAAGIDEGLNLGGVSSAILRLSGSDRPVAGSMALRLHRKMVAQWINMEHYFSAVDNDGLWEAGARSITTSSGRIGIIRSLERPPLRSGLADRHE